MTFVNAQCQVSATSSGGNTAYEQVYVLVDASGYIIDQNTVGTFSNTAPGTYRIHALNYDPFNPPSPLPADLIGQPLSQIGSVQQGCYNSDFFTDYVNRSCSSCLRTTILCETDNLIVSTSGENVLYTQLFVLVNASNDLITAVNSSGNFTGLISSGNSYRVYALNYDPSNAPNPLPINGNSVFMIGTLFHGCYNNDFLTDYLCYNVTSCLGTCYTQNSICFGDDIVATSSRSNLAYVQTYVLCDNNQNFIAHNTTGIFPTSSLIGTDFKVHALNYNPQDPPNPLPSMLSIGDPISSVIGGCFNSDFLTDFVCFNLGCLLSNNLLNFNGNKNGRKNELFWEIDNSIKIREFILERSSNGFSKFETISIMYSNNDLTNFFSDNAPHPESYYRLKIINIDGKVELSNLVYLKQDLNSFSLYPNPVSDKLHIDLNLTNSSEINFTIIDMLGQVLYQFNKIADAGNCRILFDIQSYSSGMYSLIVNIDGTQSIHKIIKK